MEKRSAFHLSGKIGFPGRKSNGTGLSTENFSKKREYLQRYSSFLVFTGITEKSLYHLLYNTSAVLLGKIHDFARENGVLLHVSVSNMRLSFWTSEIFVFTVEVREEAILPFGYLMYWFLKASTLSVTRRTTLETLLYVTLNRSAISRVVSWFAMHHKKSETCFRAPMTCLPNGFPKVSTPVPITSLTKVSKVVLFIRKWLWNSSME